MGGTVHAGMFPGLNTGGSRNAMAVGNAFGQGVRQGMLRRQVQSNQNAKERLLKAQESYHDAIMTAKTPEQKATVREMYATRYQFMTAAIMNHQMMEEREAKRSKEYKLERAERQLLALNQLPVFEDPEKNAAHLQEFIEKYPSVTNVGGEWLLSNEDDEIQYIDNQVKQFNVALQAMGYAGVKMNPETRQINEMAGPPQQQKQINTLPMQRFMSQLGTIKARMNEVKALQMSEADRLGLDKTRAEIANKQADTTSKKAALSRPQSPHGKILADRNALPEGHPDRAHYDRLLAAEEAIKNGQTIRMTADGGMEIIQGGPAGGAGLAKKTTGEIEGKILKAADGLARLKGIAGEFKPEWTELWPRIGEKFDSVKQRLGMGVSEEAKTRMSELTAWRTKALDNINRGINEITGAAMSIKEAKRIRPSMPDPGDGVWPAQSATQFTSVMNTAIQAQTMAIARYNYYLKQGLSEAAVSKMVNEEMAVPLDGVKEIINQKGDEYLEMVTGKNPKMPPDAAKAMVNKMLTEEFGVQF